MNTEAATTTTEMSAQKATAVVVAVSLTVMLLIGLLPMFGLFVTGDFPGASRFYGLQEDSTLVNGILSLRDFLVGF